jgi:hypothetical protein
MRTQPVFEPETFNAFVGEEEEEEFRVDALPASVRSAYAMGALGWPLAVQRAMAAGVRDLNALTDLVFYMHYPARVQGGRGRPLSRSEPGYDQLVQSWLAFRTLVAPLLQTRPPAAPPASTRPTYPSGGTPGNCRHAFTPIAVENPGGGRIRDKSAPPGSEIVMVESVYAGKRRPLHRLAARAWEAMVAAARADGHAHPLLLPTSGYRSPAEQQVLWDAALKKYGSPEAARKWVAPPGGSPHQTGRAIDMFVGGQNSSSNVDNLRRMPAYHWLVANAACFGFYPYEAEPWHWEYNPPAATR